MKCWFPDAVLDVTSGYFVVRPMQELYAWHLQEFGYAGTAYDWPSKLKPFDTIDRVYRGTDRDPLSAWKDSDLMAELRLDELEKQKKCDGELIFSSDDTISVLSYLEDGHAYETIWVREFDSPDKCPTGFTSLGFEPTWFTGHFSAVGDSMLLPRWHWADEEGVLLAEHHRLLNANGLFDRVDQANAFLAHYLSFDWAEQPMSDDPEMPGTYTFIEVFGTPR